MDGRVIETRTFRKLIQGMQSGRSTTEPHAPDITFQMTDERNAFQYVYNGIDWM